MPWSGDVRTLASPAVKFTPSGERLERRQPLVVVHGQDAVVLGVSAPGEQPVGRKGAECQHALPECLDDGRADDLLFLVSEQPAVPGVGLSAITAMRGSTMPKSSMSERRSVWRSCTIFSWKCCG